VLLLLLLLHSMENYIYIYICIYTKPEREETQLASDSEVR
jgi:hypothetical protein